MPTSLSRFALFGNALAILALAVIAVLLAKWQSNALVWSYPGDERMVLITASVGIYLALCLFIFLKKYREKKRSENAASAFLNTANNAKPWLVAYASQTGFAEQLAWQTAKSLQHANIPVRLLSVAQVDADVLAHTEKALFIISTTGEGDAPDSALGFSRRLESESITLTHLQFGLLALGDSSYQEFCGFGKRIDHALRKSGANELFDRIEVDNGEAGSLRHWQQQLANLTGITDTPDWIAPGYEHWKLSERVCLNNGSAGGPVFHISLTPATSSNMQWEAGDIAEIGPRNSPDTVAAFIAALGLNADELVTVNNEPQSLRIVLSSKQLPVDVDRLKGQSAQALLDLPELPHREYSIASIVSDGKLDLLLRQTRTPDGKLGLGSGWLTAYADIGSDIALRIRQNKGFHPPADERPLILIGNGTGLAGLRAHIKSRAQKQQHKNWLIFGERESHIDFYHQDEIEHWHAQGVLNRVDLAFSRDQAERVYVQDKLAEAADTLKVWVDSGAAIYVCGSLKTMAPEVHKVLVNTLGQDQLEIMAETGRYRRDVY